MCCDIVTLVYLQIYIDKHGIAGTFLVIARQTTVKLISFCQALTKLWAQQFTHDSEEIGKTRKLSICGLNW